MKNTHHSYKMSLICILHLEVEGHANVTFTDDYHISSLHNLSPQSRMRRISVIIDDLKRISALIWVQIVEMNIQ